METTTQPTPENDSRTYLRLSSAQVQIVKNRINSDRTLRLSDVASDIGVSRMTLHNIITGTNRTRLERLRELVRRLDIDPKIFFA